MVTFPKDDPLSNHNKHDGLRVGILALRMIFALDKNTDKYSPDDIFIAVMGMTGVGKTKFITDCTEEPTENKSHSLESCEYVTNNKPLYRVRLTVTVRYHGGDNTHNVTP